MFGGESGIRTRDTVPRIHTFQACAFNHSATSPSLRFRAAGQAAGIGGMRYPFEAVRENLYPGGADPSATRTAPPSNKGRGAHLVDPRWNAKP